MRAHLCVCVCVTVACLRAHVLPTCMRKSCIYDIGNLYIPFKFGLSAWGAVVGGMESDGG